MNFSKIFQNFKIPEKKIHVYSLTIKINSNLEKLSFENNFRFEIHSPESFGIIPVRDCPKKSNRFARPTGATGQLELPVYGTSKPRLPRTLIHEIQILNGVRDVP